MGNLSNHSAPLFTPLHMEKDNSESIKESGEDADQTEDKEVPDPPAMPLQAPPEKSGPLSAPPVIWASPSHPVHSKKRKFKARAAPLIPKGKRKVKARADMGQPQSVPVLPKGKKKKKAKLTPSTSASPGRFA